MTDIDLKVNTIAEDAIKDLQRTDKAVEDLEGSTKKTGSGFSAASIAAIGFNQAMEGAQKILNAAVKVYDATVTKLISYSDEVDNLSRSLGISAEESSRLLQVTDDLFISQQTLETAMRFAIKNGVDPSIEGMKDLAEQYQAIEDPIARSQFVMEKFGARAEEMNKILEVSPDRIDEMVAGFEKTGLILNSETISGTRDYKRAVDDLQDSLDSMAMALGQEIIPLLIKLLDPVTDAINRLNEARQGFKDVKNELIESSSSYKEFIALYSEAMGALAETTTGSQIYSDQLAQQHDWTTDVTEAEYDRLKATQETEIAVRGAAAAEEALSGALNAVATAQRELESAQLSWLEKTAGEVSSALKELGLSSESYKAALGTIDEVMGTSKLAEQEHKEKIDAIVKAYGESGSIADFRIALQGLKDEELPKTTEKLEEARSKAEEFKKELIKLREEAAKGVNIKIEFAGDPTALDYLKNQTP